MSNRQKRHSISKKNKYTHTHTHISHFSVDHVTLLPLPPPLPPSYSLLLLLHPPVSSSFFILLLCLPSSSPFLPPPPLSSFSRPPSPFLLLDLWTGSCVAWTLFTPHITITLSNGEGGEKKTFWFLVIKLWLVGLIFALATGPNTETMD